MEWFGDWGDGADRGLRREFYDRTPDQNVQIGCMSEEQAAAEKERLGAERAAEARLLAKVSEAQPGYGAPKLGCTIAKQRGLDVMAALGRYSAPEEVMVFEGHCPLCRAPADTRMFATDIPYFKQVIVMCTSCDACGYRTTDLKPGGEIPARGRRIALSVRGAMDLRRDIIKSESAEVEVPELDLVLARGTLGGRVTTVEGLISEARARGLKGGGVRGRGRAALLFSRFAARRAEAAPLPAPLRPGEGLAHADALLQPRGQRPGPEQEQGARPPSRSSARPRRQREPSLPR